MKRRDVLHKTLMERFMEKVDHDFQSSVELFDPDSTTRTHLKRFMTIVESRKRQILDRLLGD